MFGPTECPFCKELFVATALTECPYCYRQWNNGWSDCVPHDAVEIDPSINNPDNLNCFGVFTSIIYSIDETYCGKCGEVYPSTLSCCPRLITLAIEMLNYSPLECGPSTTNLALRFLIVEHKDSLEYVLQELVRDGTYEKRIAVRNSGILKHLDPKFRAI